ncbi:hypothetical protein C1N63_16485 [Pantoea ananatis]|uniref:hypothetical protein n=1 Tax=Pantoea ananas TaxID=553 RepID=UPI000D728CDE|nr:hypothetical protein [Pantoea ananatis]AWQ20297.1 hypothetical protein C1N63_16485 [Pantoea ananatis]
MKKGKQNTQLCFINKSKIAFPNNNIKAFFSALIAFNVLIFSGGGAYAQSTGILPVSDNQEDLKENGDKASQSDSSAIALPTMHVVLEWEWLPNGENLARKNYQVKLDACKGAGMPFKALSAQDEARLGKGEVEISIDGHHQVAKEVSWTMSAEGEDAQHACLITLEEHTDQNEVKDAAEEGMYQAIDSDSRIQNHQTAQSVGWKITGEKQYKNIPCTAWSNGKQEVCMWSGGLKWGFDDSPMDTQGCSVSTAGDFLTSIPVDAKPASGASGCLFKLKTFNINKS